MAALREHAEQTRRRIFLAYLLLPGVNDSQDHAKAIVELINGMPVQLRPQFHVNLLRYNPAEGVAVDYRRTDRQDMDRFSEHLSARDISFTIRQSFGLDIDAACGQLYKVVNKSNT
jgi:23S rRNA (adenine-C8)-methyltransferase